MSGETLLDDLLDRYEEARARGEVFAPDDCDDPELLEEFRRRVQVLERMQHRLAGTGPNPSLE